MAPNRSALSARTSHRSCRGATEYSYEGCRSFIGHGAQLLALALTSCVMLDKPPNLPELGAPSLAMSLPPTSQGCERTNKACMTLTVTS